MTFKAIHTFLYISLISLTSFGQNYDYKKYRESLTKLSCKPFDSITVAETVEQLNQLDTNQFHENIDLYYHDLGWAYYRLYMINKDPIFIRHAIDNFTKQRNPKRDYWNLAFCYFIIKDCVNGNKYLKMYRDNTDIEFWRPEEEIKRMTSKCEK